MKKIFVLLSLLFTFAAFTFIVSASSQKIELPKYTSTVALIIKADDKIQNEVYSYASRELRSLGDVEIVDINNKPDFRIEIIGLTQYIGDRETSFALSVVYLEWNDFSVFDQFIIKDTPKRPDSNSIDIGDLWIGNTSNIYTVSGHSLRTGVINDLKKACEGIVADFDAECLKSKRKIQQIIRKHNEKIIKDREKLK